MTGRRVHFKRPRLVRWLAKPAIFFVVLLAVCFPNPSATWRHLSHIRNPQSMIDPNSPGVVALAGDLEDAIRTERAKRDVGSDNEVHESDPTGGEKLSIDRQALDVVQAFVEQRVQYAFDWDTWGNVDYLPTVSEVLELGREDCDGRAVLAASLLTRLGVEARLVGNTSHVWVWTPYGETMGPQPSKAVEVTPEGVRFNWRGIAEIPRTFAFGVAVFPLFRELILVATLWLLIVPRGASAPRSAGIALLLVAALFALRRGGWPVHYGWLLGGLVLIALAVMMAAWSPRRKNSVDDFVTDRCESTDIAT